MISLTRPDAGRRVLEAFRQVHALDANDPRARFGFLAVKRDLGRPCRGDCDWLALLVDTPPRRAVGGGPQAHVIEQAGKINKIDVAGKLAAVNRQGGTPADAAPGEGGPKLVNWECRRWWEFPAPAAEHGCAWRFDSAEPAKSSMARHGCQKPEGQLR